MPPHGSESTSAKRKISLRSSGWASNWRSSTKPTIRADDLSQALEAFNETRDNLNLNGRIRLLNLPIERVAYRGEPGVPSRPAPGRADGLRHRFRRPPQSGQVADYAELSRLTGLDRPRITRIMNLRLQEPWDQERVLGVPSVPSTIE